MKLAAPLFLTGIIFCAPSPTPAADWPMFRGPNRDGISTETSAPLTWSQDKNIKWKTPLPMPGNSSPVVSHGRVFLTCAQDEEGTQRSLLCFDRQTGKQLWAQTVNYPTHEPTHQTNPYCASSPGVDPDGKHVIVWHGSAGVHCYDLDGKELWSRDLGTFRQIWGYAGSPLILGERVILNCGPGSHSFVIALSLADGKTLWKTDEPLGADNQLPQTKSWIGSWSTPVPAKIDGKTQLLVTQPRRTNAYDPQSGNILWSCAGTGDLAYTDPCVSEKLGVGAAFSGFMGPSIGFKLGGSGDVTATNRLWRNADKSQNPQRIGTGVVIGDQVFMANDQQGNGPTLQCLDLLSGKQAWGEKPRGDFFWSSTTLIANRLYATSKKGTTYVFAPDPTQFKLLATNPLNETTNSTLAPSNGEIFLRTFKHLYCIADK